ncbi:hypothetical protein [Janthinobacterium sp. LB3P118]|uniref:hypothetical protein n=1 Tax=Janthinobacterium sp. LB3P118 TaxID=3424195 RepID=UPI003F25E161
MQGELTSYGFHLHEVLELSSEATYIAYSARNTPAYKADFIDKMNAALLAMRQNGQLARIEEAYQR